MYKRNSIFRIFTACIAMNSKSNKTSANVGLLTFMRPCVDKERAQKLASSLYGLRIYEPLQVKEFVSYDDRNFYMRGELPSTSDQCNGGLTTREGEYVLKILNHVDSENISVVNAQNEVLLHLKENGFACPIPMRSLSGEYTIQCELESSETKRRNEEWKEQEPPSRVYAVRLLTFVPGILLKDVYCSRDLLFSLGCYLAKMNKALQGFQHPDMVALIKKEWDLAQLFVLESYISVISQDDAEQQVLQHVYDSFVSEVIPRLGDLQKHIIHCDVNDENVLVSPKQGFDRHEITGILDFGDVCVSYRVFEVAICMMYMIVSRVQQGDSPDQAIKMAGHILCGYQSVYSLSSSALSLLYWSVAARLFQSYVNGRYKHSLEPGNSYLNQNCVSQSKILSSYVALSGEQLLDTWLSMQ